MKRFKKGLLHGLPIGIGYFSVSIGFGLLSASGGLSLWQSALISMANLTSAGQLAGVQVMFSLGSLTEMALTQLVINLRYALMSATLSQKMHASVKTPGKLLIAFFITDEIFAVSQSEETLTKPYMAGIALLPFCGWTLGTLAGAALGTSLPAIIRGGMGILMYGMFIAILLPPAKKSRPIRTVVLLSALISVLLRALPAPYTIPSGFVVIISTAVASIFAAIRHPIRPQEEEAAA